MDVRDILKKYGLNNDEATTNKDFAEAIEVSEKGEFPTIIDWSLKSQRKLARHIDENECQKDDSGLISIDEVVKKMSDIETYEAIIISGKLLDGTKVSGEIIAQHGNFITLSRSEVNSDGSFEDVEETYFVLWREISTVAIHEMMFSKEHAGLDLEKDFEAAFDCDYCRPNLTTRLKKRAGIIAAAITE